MLYDILWEKCELDPQISATLKSGSCLSSSGDSVGGANSSSNAVGGGGGGVGGRGGGVEFTVEDSMEEADGDGTKRNYIVLL